MMDNSFRIPIADDRIDELLPPDVVAAQRELDDFRRREHEAHAVVAQAQASFIAAERADVELLAAALRAGEPDPGATTAHAAEVALAEAKRHAAALEVAAQRALEDLGEALHRADRASLVRELEGRAANARAECERHFDAAFAQRDEMAAMRSLSLFLAAYPASSTQAFGERFHDRDVWRSFRVRIVDDLDHLDLPRPTMRGLDLDDPEPPRPQRDEDRFAADATARHLRTA